MKPAALVTPTASIRDMTGSPQGHPVKPAAGAAEFIACLLAERDGTAEFVNLLVNEQTVLRDGASELLEALSRNKAAMARRLSELAVLRTRFLALQGFSPDAAGMQSWISSHPQETGAATAWRSLQSLAAQARELNQVNGALIELQLRHNQQRLAALGKACGTPMLYGPQGQRLPAPRTRQLSAA